MLTFEEKLQKYAEIIVKVGLNIQQGQRLIIGPARPFLGGVPLELAPVARAVTEEAFKVGAADVDVIYTDHQLQRIRLENMPDQSVENIPEWHATVSMEHAKRGDAFLNLLTSSPNLFSDVPNERMDTYRAAGLRYGNAVMEQISNHAMNWCLAVGPTQAWADQVMHDYPEDERLDAFWDVLFYICRIDRDDPAQAWEDHIKVLQQRSRYMNERRYQTLKYKSPDTDMTIGLVEGHQWEAARNVAQNGIEHTANIPTEEIYTMPHKDKIDGVVTSTKPLIVGGTLVDGFSLTFKNGRAVDVSAEKGEDALRKLIANDEGAARLGEVALVPHSSPISQTGRLFYNTLIDENASSHVALGRAYKTNLEGSHKMSDKEYSDRGANVSVIHVDFMIGSGQLDIDGQTADGQWEPVMRGGEWAFDVE